MSSVADNKQVLRRWAVEQYLALRADDVRTLSERIVANLKRVEEFRQARRVMVCLSFGNEVNTWPLVEEIAGDPKRQVCVPRVERDGVMHAHPYPCRLRTLGMGLRQPSPGEPELPVDRVDSLINVAVILGLTFDRERGYRLGQGKGYFDRFLAGKTFPTIGLSFEALMVDRLRVEPHDVPLRMIVTEKRIYCSA
ncbi:MAG: 5-formyltetrahydrofolate cyclo-ligase [Phycisphaerales bacterium]|nr:5-formyltetrahydrofolate cyclo-ligase [Phycisphaerales bacterium]